MRDRLSIAMSLVAESCLLVMPGMASANPKVLYGDGFYFSAFAEGAIAAGSTLYYGLPLPIPYNPLRSQGLTTTMTDSSTGAAVVPLTAIKSAEWSWTTAAAAYGSDTRTTGDPGARHYNIEPMAYAQASLDYSGGPFGVRVAAHAVASVAHRVILNAETSVPAADSNGVAEAHEIPVMIDWKLKTNAAVGSSAFANFDLSKNGINLTSRRVCINPTPDPGAACAKTENSGTRSENLERSTTQTTVEYIIEVVVGAEATGAGQSFAQAIADPFMYVDPSWQYAKYFIVQQASVLHSGEWVEVTRAWQTNPVPEPQTMFLLCAGLLGLGGWQRLRRTAEF